MADRAKLSRALCRVQQFSWSRNACHRALGGACDHAESVPTRRRWSAPRRWRGRRL